MANSMRQPESKQLERTEPKGGMAALVLITSLLMAYPRLVVTSWKWAADGIRQIAVKMFNPGQRRAFANDVGAMAGFNSIGPLVLAVVAAVIVPVVLMSLLAALAPDFFNSTVDFINVLDTLNTGKPLVDSIASIFGLVIGIVAVVAFTGLPFGFLTFTAVKKFSK